MRQPLRGSAKVVASGWGNTPFGTAETKTVGELALEGIPELLLFLLGELQQRVVKILELLILLLQRRVVTPGVAAFLATTSTTTATTAAAATILSLKRRACG